MIKRLLMALLVLSPVQAFAQLTPAPFVLQQYFANDGSPLGEGGMCVFVAGTNTLANSYTTPAGTTANANPLLFDSAGRPSSNGFFLTPGNSYKLVLKDFTNVVSPTCVPDTGVTIWTQDNIQATPGSASAVDVVVTAGESIGEGDAAFLSDGSGGLNAGQWYRTDSDLLYRSTGAVMVGMAPLAIASGDAGLIRLVGPVTATSLSPGAKYYASATPGAVSATVPTNAIFIGEALSATSILIGNTTAPVGPRGPPCGRLTLTTGVPVTTADVLAATTLYYAPFGGCNQLSFYNGTTWQEANFAQLSIAVPATTDTVYDVFAYDNAGVLALVLTAWTNDTTRATALVAQDGVWVQTGATGRRYLGSFRTTAVSGQTEDSFARRLVWNYYQRQLRPMRVLEATASWDYTVATWRQVRATATNQLSFVVGVAEDPIEAWTRAYAYNTGAAGTFGTGIGLDSTSTPATSSIGMQFASISAGSFANGSATLSVYPAVGYHTLVWLEYSIITSDITTWFGPGGASLFQSGIWGSILG